MSASMGWVQGCVTCELSRRHRRTIRQIHRISDQLRATAIIATVPGTGGRPMRQLAVVIVVIASLAATAGLLHTASMPTYVEAGTSSGLNLDRKSTRLNSSHSQISYAV